jgi:transposase-like protein
MRVLADGRVKRTPGEWRKVVEEFERSGLSASAFCRQEKISRGAFTKWRQRLQSPGREPGAFVELPMAGPASSSSLAPGEMELSLPGGVCLRWRP